MAAIYQWFVEDLQILTTNLYPLEVFEKMQIGVSLTYGLMTEVPHEQWEMSISCLDGTVRQALFEIDGGDEDWEMTISCLDGSVRVALFEIDGGEEDWEMSISSLDGTVVPSIVQVLMPDEGLQFGCSLIGGSMTQV